MDRTASVVAIFLVAFLGLSGCTSSPADAPATSPGEDSDPTSSPTPGNARNQRPVARLEVLANGTKLTPVNGTFVVPASNLTFDASGSSDPDGKTLSFQWTVDGVERSETTSVLTLALSAGNHTVNVTVSDGFFRSTASAAVRAVVASSLPVWAVAFTGSFAPADAGSGASGGKEVTKPVQVAAGARLIIVSLRWTGDRDSNSPDSADLRLSLRDETGKLQAVADTADFEFIRFAMPQNVTADGEWSVAVRAKRVDETIQWSLDVAVWKAAPVTKVFEGDVIGFVLDDTVPFTYDSHRVDIPAGTRVVVARLEWGSGPTPCTRDDVESADFDLYVWSGSTSMMSSAKAYACEFGIKAGTFAASTWEFNVVPFTNLDRSYRLTVDFL